MNEIIWSMKHISGMRSKITHPVGWRSSGGGGDLGDPHQTLKYVASINKYFLISNIFNCRKNISDNLTPHISAV